MPVRVTLGPSRLHLGRRLWRQVVTLLGAILFIVGMAAAVVAVPATMLAFAWFMGEDVAIELDAGRTLSPDGILLVWAVSAPLAIFGIGRGLRLVRGGRSLVLFLRRFGYDDATSAVTFAVTRTIGSSWRLVTLDDAEIAPVGVATGTRWLFHAVQAASSALRGAVNLLIRIFPAAQLGLWIVVAIDLVRARIWERARDADAWMAVLTPYFDIIFTALDGRLPLDAIGFDLPGLFAALAVVAAGLVIGVGTALAAAPVAWASSAALLFFSSFPADAVREAEESKTHEVRTEGEVASAVHLVAERSRRFFGPKLVVLRVASTVWRDAVRRLAAASSVALIDVSEPTEHLLWEIQELTHQARPACIFICQHERALQLAAADPSRGVLAAEVARLLELEEILAYTTDRRGRRRFARALRSRLMSAGR